MGGVKLRMTSDDSTHHSPSMLVKTIVFTYGDSTYIYIYTCVFSVPGVPGVNPTNTCVHTHIYINIYIYI